MSEKPMKFLVIDSGLYVEHANALSNKGKNTVWYYTDYNDPFPKYADYAPGKDFEYLTKVDKFWEYVDKADCIVNFDVTANDIIAYLRKHYPEKSVFGAGVGEDFEHDRWGFKKILKKIDLPVGKCDRVIGIKNLREYLKKNPDKYVKIDIFRKDHESFYAKSYDSVKTLIDERAVSFGGRQDEIPFICESPVDAKAEIGSDVIFNGTKFLDKGIWGFEYDKGPYLGKVDLIKNFPVPLKESMDKLTPIFKMINYRGLFSSEELIKSPIEHYLIDPCVRGALPLTTMYSEIIKNWSEVVYKVGLGQNVEVDIPFKYVGCCPLVTMHAKEHNTLIEIEKGHRQSIKFMMACCGKNENGSTAYYAVKGLEAVAVVIAGGNSVDEVITKLKKEAEFVTAHGLEKDDILQLDKFKNIINEAKKVGVNF